MSLVLVEPWDPSLHAPVLDEWLPSPVVLEQLPPIGRVARLRDGGPVAMGFLFTTPCAVAFLDGFVFDPRANVFVKRLAVHAVTRALIAEAERLGHTVQVAVTALPEIFADPASFEAQSLGASFSYLIRRSPCPLL